MLKTRYSKSSITKEIGSSQWPEALSTTTSSSKKAEVVEIVPIINLATENIEGKFCSICRLTRLIRHRRKVVKFPVMSLHRMRGKGWNHKWLTLIIMEKERDETDSDGKYFFSVACKISNEDQVSLFLVGENHASGKIVTNSLVQ